MNYKGERETAGSDLSQKEMAAGIATLRPNKDANLHVVVAILEPYLLPHQMRAAADFAETFGSGVCISSGAIYRLETDEELEEEEVVTSRMHENGQGWSSDEKPIP